MPVINRIAGLADEMTQWRQYLHTIPELEMECYKTAAFIAERLREFGVDEVHEGIGVTGIVAIINGQGDGPTIGLRADMDALPIEEATGLDYASTHPGNMHACGHDGHTTMLLGAAKYLTETRNFSGRVALIFQPGEEGPGGAKIMVEEGFLDRFDIGEVYGIHNVPDLPEGEFHTRAGPIMAAVDTFHIYIDGVGGHGAMPEETRDPVIAACGIGQAIQTIISRNVPSLQQAVVSLTQIHTGTANNVIPAEAYLNGTIRTFDKTVQEMVHRRLDEIAQSVATGYGVTARLEIEVGYPSTVNAADQTAFAADVARELVGAENVDANTQPVAGAEDFAFMLEQRPGAYLFMGQGPSAGLHHPAYNFNDAVAPYGASFFARLVETAQPAKAAK
ncbi:amidohydrolase [Aliishimia ponticola]|uniref:Amidohydrolase n=1 Tax=Aliishimia ponticola TaxID=2499833 RepID=A0A4V3XKV8_9RHOB|nr:M20 aminoacylase family protein [Aliishimia ponticola]THH38433.1 amidohydrolase [Aliishimia ponticola]